MAQELHESVKALGLLDAPLCVCFASVLEDTFTALPPLDGLSLIKKVGGLHTHHQSHTHLSPAHRWLPVAAFIRWT